MVEDPSTVALVCKRWKTTIYSSFYLHRKLCSLGFFLCRQITYDEKTSPHEKTRELWVIFQGLLTRQLVPVPKNPYKLPLADLQLLENLYHYQLQRIHLANRLRNRMSDPITIVDEFYLIDDAETKARGKTL